MTAVPATVVMKFLVRIQISDTGIPLGTCESARTWVGSLSCPSDGSSNAPSRLGVNAFRTNSGCSSWRLLGQAWSAH